MGNVGGEQVVHLVSEAGLEHQLGVGAAVPDREVEEAGPRHPVDDVAEGQRRQQVLGLNVMFSDDWEERGHHHIASSFVLSVVAVFKLAIYPHSRRLLCCMVLHALKAVSR